jgi:hypothetical protein
MVENSASARCRGKITVVVCKSGNDGQWRFVGIFGQGSTSVAAVLLAGQARLSGDDLSS